MSANGLSLPHAVAEPSVALAIHPTNLIIDGMDRTYDGRNEDEITVRVHEIVEAWDQLSISFELRPIKGAFKSKAHDAIARVICTTSPSRHAIPLIWDGSCWKGALDLDRNSYRGVVSVTGELLANALNSGIAQPRATFESSPEIRIELDPVEAPPSGSIRPHWVDFTTAADRYREIQVLSDEARAAATSLLAFELDTQEWHWLWNKANPGWKGILPDGRPFGTRFNARRVFAILDFSSFFRTALLVGTQGNLASMWEQRVSGDESAELERHHSPLLGEVTDWSLREFFRLSEIELEDEGEAVALYRAMEDLPGELTAWERSGLLLMQVAAKVTSFVQSQQELASDLPKIKEALIRANSPRYEED
jgi:hypothetical protein